MPYATSAQIQVAAGGAAKLVEIFDWDKDGVADAAVIADLQAKVDAWIDSFAGKRFAVPMASPSIALQQLSAEEVVYRGKRGLVSEYDTDQHKERLSWLEAVAAGKVVPCDPPPAPASTVRSAWVARDTDDVSREKLKGAW